MKFRSVFLVPAFVFLAACDLAGSSSYRDTDAPISASIRFETNAFSGAWTIVDSFGQVSGRQMHFEPNAPGDIITVSGTGLRGVDGQYRQGVPGELIPTTGGTSPLVVMWVDESRDTAVIGTVSGSFGALIDRDGRVPPDKSLAARAIFEFYGWDISQLSGATS